jgi:hypothetical protein
MPVLVAYAANTGRLPDDPVLPTEARWSEARSKTRSPDPPIGKDARLNQPLDLGVQIARIGAGLTGDIGDTGLPVRL